MSDLLLYLGITIVGYFLGVKLRPFQDKITWAGKIQTVAIIMLVAVMGLRMGSNDEVTGQLDSIGLYAFVMTVLIMVLSVTAITVTRKILGIDRYGRLKTDNNAESSEAKSVDKADKKIDSMTIIVLVALVCGMLVGYFFIDKVFSDVSYFDMLAGKAITIGLCILLVFVGLDLGLEGTVVGNFKKVGWRIMAFPFAVMIGTFLGSLISVLILPITLKESMAIGAGFGWYTLAPGIIMENGMVTASAISFMHNVMRELFSILLIPVVAKKIGYVETTSMPGGAAMDVCLPIVEKSTRSDIAVYSFISGAVLSIAVPIMVPIIVGL